MPASSATTLSVARCFWSGWGRSWPSLGLSDPAAAVLAHGDAHARNTPLVPGDGPPCFEFVNPEGLLVERAYDLGIPMREWGAELLAGDPVALGRRRCRPLARFTGVAPEPIWQWGFVERVSTGLLLLKLGLGEAAASSSPSPTPGRMPGTARCGGRERYAPSKQLASARPDVGGGSGLPSCR